MSSKKIAMNFIDETTGRLLDDTYKLLKQYKNGKKEADKLLKYIIKSVVKVSPKMNFGKLFKHCFIKFYPLNKSLFPFFMFLLMSTFIFHFILGIFFIADVKYVYI